jgi:hypothetical protein
VALPEVVATPELTSAPEPVAAPEIPDPIMGRAAGPAVPSIAPEHVLAAAPGPERVSFKELADSLLGAMTATQEALAHTATDAGTKPEPVVEEVVGVAAEALEPKAPSASPAPAHPIAEKATPPVAPALPQGFEGLKFPNDGVLTRQWMEFLSQMSTTK